MSHYSKIFFLFLIVRVLTSCAATTVSEPTNVYIAIPPSNMIGNKPECVAAIPKVFNHGENTFVALSFSGLNLAGVNVLENCQVKATLEFGSDKDSQFFNKARRDAKFYNGEFVFPIKSSSSAQGYRVRLSNILVVTPDGKLYTFPEVYTNKALVN